MNSKRLLGIMIVLSTLAVAFPVSGYAADDAGDLSVYFRPAVRFGTDDRVLFIMDFLVPVHRGDSDIVFINTKFTPDTDEAWETNLGVGYRRMLSDRLILGGNLFYDHRRTAYGSHFDQFGLGLEAMAELNGLGLATRINYYQPLNKAKLGEDFGYVFYGNGIYTAGIEEPMTGFDYEAGVRIPWVSDYVETWAYAGGYHFFGSHVPDVNGFSARIEAIPTDFVRLTFEYRNDNVNLSEYYGEVALEIPFSITNLVAGKNAFEGIGDVFTGNRSLKERMTEPVHRDVDIVVGKDYLSGPEAASGEGDLAAGVIFVSDVGTDSGTGTFENPYNTLAKAEADPLLGSSIHTIHVMRGNRTGLIGNDFDTNSVGVTIWGAGATNPKYPYVANLIPGWPLVTSTLTMNAPNMTVMGLYFKNSSGGAIAIAGGAAGGGLLITKNLIESTGTSGIDGDLTGNLGTPACPAVISENIISVVNAGTGDAYGIRLWSDGVFTGSITRNMINTVRNGSSSAYGMNVLGFAGFNGSITDNTVSHIISSGGTAAGIAAGTLSGTAGGTIAGNTITGVFNSSWWAVGILASGGIVTTSIVGNAMEVGGNSPMGIFAIGTAVGTASTPMVVTGNTGTISVSGAGTHNGPYMMWLNLSDTANSNLHLGFDTGGSGMGDNAFTSATGVWSGNFPAAGGPIRADGGSYVHYVP